MISYLEIEAIKKAILDEIVDFQEVLVKEAIQSKISALPELGTEDKKKLYKKVYQSIFGYDVIQPLLENPDITEIMINGLDAIFIERHGRLYKSDLYFESKDQIMQLIHKICAQVGREVNLGSPTLDARLNDGSRVNIILDPVALNGPVVTIRKFKKALSDSAELMASGMFTASISKLFACLVSCKFNLFICGSTGSGKTTLLNCLSSFIDRNERIVTIEDAAEISLIHHENVVSMETRKSHQSVSAIDMSHLIKNALRMRPDRIIVGEVRGDEVVDMLQAMNTGHDGSLSTGHSNSPIDMLTRLEVIASSYSAINHLLIRKQIISAIDFLVFLEKLPDGRRIVSQISEVIKGTPDYVLNVIYTLEDTQSQQFEDMIQKIANTSKLRRYNDAAEKT